MTPESFRKLAISFPGAVEGEHAGHPDFRAGGRIFATLFGGETGEESGMVKVTPEEQETLVRDHPDVFSPCAGAWGRQGCTAVHLEAARVAVLRGPMRSAWQAAVNAASRPRSPGPSRPATESRRTRPR